MNNVFASLNESAVAPTAPPEGEAPPPYTTLPRSPSEAGATPWAGPAAPSGVISGAGYAPSGVRLGYMDFVPRIVQKRVFNNDEYETFDALIQRANTWLEEHTGLQIVAVETVTWSGLRTKNIFPDSCVFCKSMNASRQTKYLQGMRIWYFMDVFPNPNAHPIPTVLRVKTFVPLHNERFDQLLVRVNDYLGKEPLGGRIISIETIRVKGPDTDVTYSPQQVNPNRCFWKEFPDSNKRYVLCIRVYALFGQELPGYETIGYQDFVPEKHNRSQENDGYEIFSDVGQKVSRWLARQQGVRFTNIQTLCVKMKKKGAFEERCIFIEHICANNRSNILKGVNRRTPYLRVVRCFFVVHNMPGPRTEFPALRMTYRTFTPGQAHAAANDGSPAYENMRLMLDRINQWLQITGAKVFSLETVPVQMTPGPQQMLGAEATHMVNTTGSYLIEKWLYHIRVYFDGEYIEPPGAVGLVAPPGVSAPSR